MFNRRPLARNAAPPKPAGVVHSPHLSAAANTVPAVNKVHLIRAVNTVPSAPWALSTTTVEFAIPQHLGKLIDMCFKFDIVASSVAGGALQLTPSTFFCQKIEYMLNANVLETVESNEIHQETCNYIEDQRFQQIYKLVNLSATGGNAPVTILPTGDTSFTFYLPLWHCFLQAAQPFVKGFNDEIRIRLTLNSDIKISNAAQADLALKDLTLLATEANLSDNAYNQLAAAHRSGIAYKTVLRNKFTKQLAQIAQNEVSEILTTFNSDSAGLLVYITPQAVAPGTNLVRSPLQYVQLRDAANSELTIQLPGEYIESFVMPSQLKVSSNMVNNASNNSYLFPFAANFNRVIREGVNSGGLKLTGQERVCFKAPIGSTFTNVQLNVVSYDYAILSVAGGRAAVARHA